ncbi:hypothetical protein LCM17_23165 [Cereibacter sphaeroides]|nr:hypothetical protein [Cereibacter sphaeroides]
MTADKPIIFSGPMVRALLDGRKTQTRRLLKPQPIVAFGGICEQDGIWWTCDSLTPLDAIERLAVRHRIGDRLYVREAWRTAAAYDDLPPIDLGGEEAIRYEVDGHIQTWGWPESGPMGRYRHARFMPRWASRLTLIVTDVRVQRLQEISAQDTIAEGVWCETCEAMRQSACYERGCFASADAFRSLWNSLHGPEAWGANPWVAAVSFAVHRCNIDQMDAQQAIPATPPSWPAASAEKITLPAIDETTGALIRKEGEA